MASGTGARAFSYVVRAVTRHTWPTVLSGPEGPIGTASVLLANHFF